MAIRYIKYFIVSLLGLAFAGCSESDSLAPREEPGAARVIGDKVILTSSLNVPEFQRVATRGFSETPTLSDLKLYLVEFVDNGSPLTNTLRRVYRPETETADAANSVVTYTVTLDNTDQPRILHLIAVADDDLQIPYGVESAVIPGLTGGTSADGQGIDAYWRRLKFPAGYSSKNDAGEWIPNQDLQDKLIDPTVQLVRNFAKVTVGIDDAAVYPENTSFTLQGFLIVNTPLKGSFAPYSSSNRDFPEFFGADGKQLSYQELAQTYRGYSPANTTLGNQVTSEDAPVVPDQTLTAYTTTEGGTTKSWKCLPSQYLYERPFNSISRTFIIIKGIYHNSVTNPQDRESYYKLDLGANDNNGIFRYYGLIRNFNYFIRIKSVRTNGYSTAAEAAEGTVYNNISFDIDTDHLMNMSDGSDIIRVNTTTLVITDNDQVYDFRYAYKQGITGSDNGHYNNNAASIIGLDPADIQRGGVIKSVTNLGDQTISGTPWRTLQIAFENPTTVTKTQEFTVVNSQTGLGRTINLVSHLKWDFESLRNYAGIWENYPSTYKGLDYDNKDVLESNLIDDGGIYFDQCGTAELSQFTIFFDIPDNIPEALFPLEFTIESLNQGLENEPMGTIVVSPGPTLFPTENGTGEMRIQYNKSVTWTEYNAALRMDARNDNGTAIGNPEDGPVTHRVRCRFRTIENVANNTHVRVRIANQNFNTGEVQFDRTSSANGLTGPGLVQ